MPDARQPLRLADIDPDAFATDLCRRVVDDLHHRAFGLGPVILRLDGLEEIKAATLYHEARDLALWAVRGEIEHVDHTHDLCLAIATAAWPSALYGADDGSARELAADADPETEPAILITAAFAREKLAHRRPVTPRELAVLAGVTGQHVRLLTRGVRGGQPEIRARSTEQRRGSAMEIEIPAAEARRWLSGRGVPGVGR